MNTTLLWLLLLPIMGAGALYYFNRDTLPWFAGPVSAVPGMILIAIVFAASYGSAVSDTEIWNGQVVSKERKHGTYEESYDCNCRTVYSGTGKDRTSSTKCDTFSAPTITNNH